MIFYEAPHKLRATLDDLLAAFGPERRISLCREMTKLHEEVLHYVGRSGGTLCRHAAQRVSLYSLWRGTGGGAGGDLLEDGAQRVLALRGGGCL